jgi:gliding motility-associated-like protein
VFTPNSEDDKNTEFVIEGESLDEYGIKIFNRWGESVFESTDINYSWNGRVNNTGDECPEGTYFYIINYTFKFGEKNEGKGPIEGSVDLIRE